MRGYDDSQVATVSASADRVYATALLLERSSALHELIHLELGHSCQAASPLD